MQNPTRSALLAQQTRQCLDLALDRLGGRPGELGRLNRLPEVVVQLLNRIGSLEKPGMQEELVNDI